MAISILEGVYVMSIYVAFGSAYLMPMEECTGVYTRFAQDICYRMYTDTATWRDALDQCVADGGPLATPSSEEKQLDIEELLDQYSVVDTDIWIGGRIENSESLTGTPQSLWRWVSSDDYQEEVNNIITACKLLSVPDVGTPGRSGRSARDVTVDLTGGLDIAFVVDNSGSISDPDWISILELMISFVDKLDIGETDDKCQVSVIKFGNAAEKLWSLDAYTTANVLKTKISEITHEQENTNTSAGIRTARTEVFSGNRGDRPGVPNIVILVTDGKSTFSSDRTVPEAQLSKDESIITFVIGITDDVNVEEIKAISDSPQVENVNYWLVSDFSDLENDRIFSQVLQQVCNWQERHWMMTNKAIVQQGCYTEVSSARDLPFQVTLSNPITPDSCLAACSDLKFDFAGLQRDNCYCGNEFGKYGPSSGCNHPCAGDNSVFCGGFSSNTVYMTVAEYEGNWAAGEPSSTASAWCAALSRLDNSKYTAVGCNVQYRFHCKLPLDQCPGSVNDGTYITLGIPFEYCLFTSYSYETWFTARYVCQLKGGDLLTIENNLERSAVHDALSNGVTWLPGETGSLIGLFKKPFKWTKGRAATSEIFNYENFYPDITDLQPNPASGDCLQMKTSAAEGKFWFTSRCDSRKNFICEWETDFQSTSTVPPTTSSELVTTETSTGTTMLSTTENYTTTTTMEQTTTGAAPQSGPSAGASTGESGGLSTTYKILIAVLCILVVVVIIILIYFCCCRKKEAGLVHPKSGAYDASSPYSPDISDPWEEEYGMFAQNGGNGSKAKIIKYIRNLFGGNK